MIADVRFISLVGCNFSIVLYKLSHENMISETDGAIE